MYIKLPRFGNRILLLSSDWGGGEKSSLSAWPLAEIARSEASSARGPTSLLLYLKTEAKSSFRTVDSAIIV